RSGSAALPGEPTPPAAPMPVIGQETEFTGDLLRQIREATGIGSHQQVYLLTRELSGPGWIQDTQRGRERAFCADESVGAQLSSPGRTGPGEPYLGPRASAAFTEKVIEAMSAHLGVSLGPGVVPGVPRAFELVSSDRSVVGCALYYAPVQGQRLPPAKFSLIGERVWLLEKSGAALQFLVFGYDRDVPLLWLKRYGHLTSGVQFYYLDDEGVLEEIDRENRDADL
ncbi:MAG: hypothetical protein JXA89_05590, partial [Anaerolineae bacterium]|nr:hypothetical protein [Anaerolineae bacterium]